MGFLSKAAESTFTKTRRRAYVPEWFKPFSYVAAAAAVGGLLLMGAFGEDSLEAASTEVQAEELVTPSAPASEAVQPSGGPTAAPSPTATSSSAADGTAEKVQLTTPSGDVVTVPRQAVDSATRAAQALFTGNFSDVPLVPGQVPPTVSSPWPNAAVSAPRSVTLTSTNSSLMSFVIPVDPDGAAGSESPRDVSVSLRLVDGTWVYLPYASG